MWWTKTAIRDPFFYRWHGGIDQRCVQLQGGQDQNNFDEYAAQVRFRDDQPDILLCLSRDIPGAAEPGFDFDAFGRERLGEDLSGAAEIDTTVLPTRFVLSEVTAPVPGNGRETYWTTHLMHEPFTYFLRVDNTQSEPQWVTVRTFFSHADLFEDRRIWIELDKFEKELAPGVNVVGRPDALLGDQAQERPGARCRGSRGAHDRTVV